MRATASHVFLFKTKAVSMGVSPSSDEATVKQRLEDLVWNTGIAIDKNMVMRAVDCYPHINHMCNHIRDLQAYQYRKRRAFERNNVEHMAIFHGTIADRCQQVVEYLLAI